jgi:O-antigen/teichoic acid export membrane protein
VRRLAAEFWRFAAPRGVAATFQTLVLWLDVLLVGAMTSTRQAGIYATASRFVLLGTLAIEAVRLAIAPQLGAMFARNDLAGAQRMYGVATWWLMVPSWPVYIVIAAFAPVFLRLFGEGFSEAQDVLVILSIAMLFNIGTGNVTVVLLMAGKSVWNLGNALIAFVINLGLNLLLIPRLGITGAAIAWTVSIVWENLAPLVQIRRAFGLTPFGRGYVRVATAALVVFGGVALVIRFAFGAGVPQLILAVLIAIGPYVYVLMRARGELEAGVLVRAMKARPSRPGGDDGSIDAAIASIDEEGETVI